MDIMELMDMVKARAADAVDMTSQGEFPVYDNFIDLVFQPAFDNLFMGHLISYVI